MTNSDVIMTTRPNRRQTSSNAQSAHKSKHEFGEWSHHPTRASQGSSESSGLPSSRRSEKRYDKRHSSGKGEEGKYPRIGKAPRNDLSSFQWGSSSARHSSVSDDTLKCDSVGVTKESPPGCSISLSKAKTRPRKAQYSGRDLPVSGENHDRKQSETSKTGPYSLAAQIHKVKESIISNSAEGINSVRRKRLSARKSTSGRNYNPGATTSSTSSSTNTGGSPIRKQVVAVDEEVSFKLPITDLHSKAERQLQPHTPNHRPKEESRSNCRSKMGSSSERDHCRKVGEEPTVNERSVTGKNEEKHTSSQPIKYSKYKNLAKYVKTGGRNKTLAETSTSMERKHKFHFVSLSQAEVSPKLTARSPHTKYVMGRSTQSKPWEVTKYSSDNRPGNHTNDHAAGSSSATYTSETLKRQNIKEGWKMLSLEDVHREDIAKRTKSKHGSASSQVHPQQTGQLENNVIEGTKASLNLPDAGKEEPGKLQKHSSERNIFDMFKIPSMQASSSDQSDKNIESVELSSENSEPLPSSAGSFGRAISSTTGCGNGSLGAGNLTPSSTGVMSKEDKVVSCDSSDGDNIFEKIASVKLWKNTSSATERPNAEVSKEGAPSKTCSQPLEENAFSEVKDPVRDASGDINEKASLQTRSKRY